MFIPLTSAEAVKGGKNGDTLALDAKQVKLDDADITREIISGITKAKAGTTGYVLPTFHTTDEGKGVITIENHIGPHESLTLLYKKLALILNMDLYQATQASEFCPERFAIEKEPERFFFGILDTLHTMKPTGYFSEKQGTSMAQGNKTAAAMIVAGHFIRTRQMSIHRQAFYRYDGQGSSYRVEMIRGKEVRTNLECALHIFLSSIFPEMIAQKHFRLIKSLLLKVVPNLEIWKNIITRAAMSWQDIAAKYGVLTTVTIEKGKGRAKKTEEIKVKKQPRLPSKSNLLTNMENSVIQSMLRSRFPSLDELADGWDESIVHGTSSTLVSELKKLTSIRQKVFQSYTSMTTERLRQLRKLEIVSKEFKKKDVKQEHLATYLIKGETVLMQNFRSLLLKLFGSDGMIETANRAFFKPIDDIFELMQKYYDGSTLVHTVEKKLEDGSIVREDIQQKMWNELPIIAEEHKYDDNDMLLDTVIQAHVFFRKDIRRFKSTRQDFIINKLCRNFDLICQLDEVTMKSTEKNLSAILYRSKGFFKNWTADDFISYHNQFIIKINSELREFKADSLDKLLASRYSAVVEMVIRLICEVTRVSTRD
jgi:hypothetical protein